MCGIAGIFNCKQNVRPEWIAEMTNILKHRGPDDEGFLAINTRTKEIYPLTGSDSKVDYPRIEVFDKDANLFLGHRRLSILDLSSLGHQPMCNIMLNFFMIPIYGPLGAAFATTISYAIYAIILFVSSHRLYQISYPWLTWILPVIWLICGVPMMAYMPEKSCLYTFVGFVLFIGVFFHAGGFRRDWLVVKEYA